MGKHKRRVLGRRPSDLVVAMVVCIAYGFFAILPVGLASGLGGRVGRTIGPRLGISRRATRNLVAAFPEASDADIASIVKDMWESLSRNAAEAPHLRRLARNIGQPGAHVSVDGIDNIAALPAGQPLIVFSGHIANWEVLLGGMAALGYAASPVYRDPNNPYLARLLRRLRQMPGIELVPKGTAGARMALTVLSRGDRLIMLVDQKMNNGVAVPFFGRDAMTAPALARFALRFKCPIVPLRLERTEGPNFHLTIGAPLDMPADGQIGDPTKSIMGTVNNLLESWIKKRPAQWLWLHNRWPY